MNAKALHFPHCTLTNYPLSARSCCAMETILYAFSFIVPSIFLSDSSESRSRSLKNCVHQGLGRCLNKQKPIRSVESGMDGFSHFVIQMHCLPVLCQTWHNSGKQCICAHKPCCDKSCKQCLWRTICEKRAFPFRRICAFSACWEISQAL